MSDLLDFSTTFPNLTLEEKRRLTRTACSIFKILEKSCMSSRNVDECLIGIDDTGYGPYGTSVSEFLKLPEIACLIYPLQVQSTMDESRNYRSYCSRYDLMAPKRPIKFIFSLRRSIVWCVHHITKKGGGDKLGAVKLGDVCKVWNKYFSKAQKWTLHPTGKLSFCDFELFVAICFFCSRELVIRVAPKGESDASATIRLRTSFQHNEDELTKEEKLKDKAIEVYEYHLNVNPDNVNWSQITPDIEYFICWEGKTNRANYNDSWFNNVFGAIHYSNEVNDYESLLAVITKHTPSSLENQVANSTPNLELNQLMDMAAYESLEAVSYWGESQRDIYFKIFNEQSCGKLNKCDRAYLLHFIDLVPEHRCKVNMYIVTISKIVHHILMATNTPYFISENRIAKFILKNNRYNIYQLLSKMGIPTITDLILYYAESFDLLNAIAIQREDDGFVYRNMYNILNDHSLTGVFPHEAKYRIIEAVNLVISNGNCRNGLITENAIRQAYHQRFHRPLDAREQRRIFGAEYENVGHFLVAFCTMDIILIEQPNEVISYRVAFDDMEEAHMNIIKRKKIQMKAVRDWRRIVEKAISNHVEPPHSAFTSLKKNMIHYEAHLIQSQHTILTHPVERKKFGYQ